MKKMAVVLATMVSTFLACTTFAPIQCNSHSSFIIVMMKLQESKRYYYIWVILFIAKLRDNTHHSKNAYLNHFWSFCWFQRSKKHHSLFLNSQNPLNVRGLNVPGRCKWSELFPALQPHRLWSGRFLCSLSFARWRKRSDCWPPAPPCDSLFGHFRQLTSSHKRDLDLEADWDLKIRLTSAVNVEFTD